MNPEKIVLFFLLFITHPLLQAQLTTSSQKTYLIQKRLQINKVGKGSNLIKRPEHTDWRYISALSNPNLPPQKYPVPVVYSPNDLAFFCKIEVQLEKAVKVPIKFRLGSVDQVDFLEGKRRKY